MKFYFSSKDIPELAELSIRDRAEKVQKAKQKLTVPEKLILNLLKLALLIPPFIYLARQDWTALLIITLVSTVIRQVIVRPIMYYFLSNQFKKKTSYLS